MLTRFLVFWQPTPNKFTRRSATLATLKRAERIDVAVYSHCPWGISRCARSRSKNSIRSPRDAQWDWRCSFQILRVIHTTGPSVLALTVFLGRWMHTSGIESHSISSGNERSAEARYRRWLTKVGRMDDVQHSIRRAVMAVELTISISRTIAIKPLDRAPAEREPQQQQHDCACFFDGVHPSETGNAPERASRWNPRRGVGPAGARPWVTGRQESIGRLTGACAGSERLDAAASERSAQGAMQY